MKTIIRLFLILLFMALAHSGLFAQRQSEPDQEPVLNPVAIDQQDSSQDKTDQPSVARIFEGKKPIMTVSTSVSKAKITIGEKITYRIDVVAHKDIKVEFPQFAEFLGGFSITDYNAGEPVKSGKTIRWTREYVLDVFLTGTYAIPPARISYQLANGEPKQLFTAPLFVSVESILPDDEVTLKEIKPVALPELALSKTVIVTGIGALIAMIGLMAGIIIWLKKRNQSVTSVRPAHLIALEALDNLKKQGLAEAGQIKEYYFLVSNILRHYIEKRFGLMAPERTTEEFMDELRNTTVLEQNHKSILEKFLTHCDMVKFAKYTPSEEQIERVYETAVDFINQTKPEETTQQPDYDDEYEDE